MSNVAKGPDRRPPREGKSCRPQPAPGVAPPHPPAAQPTAGQSQKSTKNLMRRPLYWVLLVIAVVFAGCNSTGAGVTASYLNQAPPKQTVVYSVTGSGTPKTPLITYATLQDGAGKQGLAQVSNADLPWSKTITVSGQITAFSVSVQNGPVGLSYVVCTITENGKVLNTNTAKGPFAFASCNAVGEPS